MGTRLAAGLAALVLATALPAGASPPAVPALRGTVTLSGTTSYARDVLLRKTTRFTRADWTVVSSGGRYAGFVLRRAGGGMQPTVASIAPGYCTTRGCARPAWSGTYTTDLFTGTTRPELGPIDDITLLPGRYRLHLVADGKPVSVTLRFPGSGRTAFRSGARSASAIDVPRAATWDPADTGNRYSAGAARRTGAEVVFHYLAAWKYFYGPPRMAHQEGICVANGPPADTGTGRYQHGCHGPLEFFVFGQHPTGRKAGPGAVADEFAARLEYFGVLDVVGEISIGGYVNSALPSTGAHMTILWVDLG